MDSSHKRPLESTETGQKRPKVDEDINNDLIFLKASIKKEVSGDFSERFANLENNLKQLQEKYDGLKQQIDELKQSTSSETAGAALYKSEPKSLDRPVLNKEPPALPPRETQEIKPKHTFGGTAFNVKPLTTPLSSVASIGSPQAQEKTPKSTNTSPNPVFGASTSFGNGPIFNSMNPKRNILESLSSQPKMNDDAKEKPNSTEKAATTSSFGSNSKFNNAFQNSLKKKSFLDGEESSAVPPEGKGSDTQQYQQINLTKVDNKTGEEDEKSHYSTTCKLFELNLSQMSEGWKERGLGPIHLNQSVVDKTQVRLVMRAHGLLRVILNTKITADTTLLKGLEASLTPGKYLRFNSVNEKGLPIQYLLKFSNQTTRDELIDKIEELKDSLKTKSDSTSSNDETVKANGVKWM